MERGNVRFVSHSSGLKNPEELFSRYTTSRRKHWLDPWTRRDLARAKREQRVKARANLILEAYKRLQRDATARALIWAERRSRDRFGGARACAVLAGWMKMDTIGAKGLDIPGRHSTIEGAFHMKMARAKGGLVHDGNKWTGMKLPERHMDVQREAYLRRGVNLPTPRETGEVNDVPPHLLRSKIVAEVKRHRANGNGKPMRVLVLFAGGGGASEGWRHVDGARTVCAVEMNGDAATVYSANHDHPVLQLNIADWVGVALALKQYGPFDLVQWSPPCQPHSNANANKICNDPRETVMLAAARLIKALDVPHFVMENVVGVKSSPVWLRSKSFLAQAGYKTLELVVNANHCGVPQNRERLFAVGSKVVTTKIWESLASQAFDYAAEGPDTLTRTQEFGGH